MRGRSPKGNTSTDLSVGAAPRSALSRSSVWGRIRNEALSGENPPPETGAGLPRISTVTDVGAGSGYFSFPLAAALPEDLVRAVDIEPEMIRHIHHRVLEEKLGNLKVALATPEDPGVESETDLVFVCDVLHHVSDPDFWLATLRFSGPSSLPASSEKPLCA